MDWRGRAERSQRKEHDAAAGRICTKAQEISMTPIKITLPLVLEGPARMQALRALNARHGHPEGVPLDAHVDDDHLAATHRLLIPRELTLEIVDVTASGELVVTFGPSLLGTLLTERTI
jgi:hypothetical protein